MFDGTRDVSEHFNEELLQLTLAVKLETFKEIIDAIDAAIFGRKRAMDSSEDVDVVHDYYTEIKTLLKFREWILSTFEETEKKLK